LFFISFDKKQHKSQRETYYQS